MLFNKVGYNFVHEDYRTPSVSVFRWKEGSVGPNITHRK